jgi:hypothetical protein
MMGAFDIGDVEPDGVVSVRDCTYDPNDCESDDSPLWGRTSSGEWKGFKNGYKTYLSWDELVRRWGPVIEIQP